MTKLYRYIVLSIIGLASFSMTGYSQSYVEKKLENIILTAVEKLNDQDIAGAKAILSDLVAADTDNDAAWYYMGQGAVYESDIALAEECFRMAAELDPSNFWY